MSQAFRVLLQICQACTLLAALLLLATSVMLNLFDFDLLTLREETDLVGWATGFGVLSIAFSPALWLLRRGAAAPAAPATGGFERVPAQQSGQSGGGFEPMNADQAPAPPASSYGRQPQAGGYGGGITPASPSPTDTPWGSSR